ncbi:MAG: hypothetical protein Tsb009_27460 [Planctomycetaceae bacterium]
MKIKTVMLLGVALACGLVAMIGVQQVMSGPAENTDKPDEVQVLVATADIDPFTPLDESNTGFKVMPAKDVPPGAVTSRDECEERTLKYGVVENDIILSTKLTKKNHSPSDEIPDGMRVVTVKVNQTKTHSGLIRPGDFVDVVLTYEMVKQDRRRVKRTLTILQNVKVFATDHIRRVTTKTTDNTELNAKNMSLLVTPADANLLMLAENKGALTMALRKGGQTEPVEIRPVDESIFEDLTEPKNASESIASNNQKQNEQALEQDFQKYLAESNQQPKVVAQNTEPKQETKEPAPVEKKTWKITIFNGSTRRVEEVELEGENEAEEQQSTKDKTSRKPSSKLLKKNEKSKEKPVRAKRPDQVQTLTAL